MRRFAPLIMVLLSAIAVAGFYWQTLDYPFILDDTSYVKENPMLSGLHLTELWRLFTDPYNEFSEFLPLRDLSYWLDMKLFGLAPSVFRSHNIFLYLLCLPLTYGVTLNMWRYFRPGDSASAPLAAAVITSLFALHPAHVEAVVWIAGRKDVLAALFSLLALWLAMSTKREYGFSMPHAAATLGALAAAILSKASAVGIAPVITMLWIFLWRDLPAPNRRGHLLLWPLASMLLAACLAIIFATIITSRTPTYFGVETITRPLAILGWLLRLSISPEHRQLLYPVLEDPFLSFRIALGIAVIAGAAVGAVLALRKRSLEGFALTAFLLFCLPSLQLIPYALPSLVSDRFIFLSVWPVILLIVALSWRLKPLFRTAMLLITIAFPWGVQTFERPRDWRTFEALIDANLRGYPGYYMPAVYKVIDQYTHGELREAITTADHVTIPEFRDAIIGLIKADIVVTYAAETGKSQEAVTQLWKLWLDHKQLPDQAKWNPPIRNLWITKENMFSGEWTRLAESFPDDMSIHYNVGLWMLDTQNNEKAITQLRLATESQRLPENIRGNAFKNLGLSLLNSGHTTEAEAPLRAALEQQQPDLQAYCLLSEVYKQSNRIDEKESAETECRNQALHNDPAMH
jgi:hypothetical protein